jgi:hypothetical protein
MFVIHTKLLFGVILFPLTTIITQAVDSNNVIVYGWPTIYSPGWQDIYISSGAAVDRRVSWAVLQIGSRM